MRLAASVVTSAVMVLWSGCSSKTTEGEDPPAEPDPKGWTITVDMSRLDRFVQPDTATAWEVGGTATATEGLDSIEVNGAAVTAEADGWFVTEVEVAPGLTRVPILVRDRAGHERKADRTLLAARFLPDGNHNATAASLVLDNAILASMSSGIAAQAGTVDIAGEILARPTLSSDSQCTTWPLQARQGAMKTRLVLDRGDLWLHIQVPNLYVYFGGSCQGLLNSIPIAGEMGGTIDIWTKLTPKPPTDGSCLTAFTHTRPEVQIAGWGFNVWGVGGPLQNWMVAMFQGEKSTEARTQLTTEVRGRADTLLRQKLADVTVFDRTSELELLGRPISMHLCLGGLDKVGTTLIARVAASAVGAGGREAPGAPQLDGGMPGAKAKELVLDGNLVGQLLYASWRDGGLTRTAPDISVDVLQTLVPDLYERFPDATTAQIAIDAELPPLVRATPGGPGDLKIELGDLMIDLSIEGKRVFRFGVTLTILLDLIPQDGKLLPSVLDTVAEVALLDELYDGPDAALEAAVKLQIGNAAADLLGSGAAIALPDLPGLGAPMDVTPDEGGRFVRVKLQ